MNRLTKYFLWLLAFITFLYLGALIYYRLMEYARDTFRILPSLFFASLFPILVGMVLGLPKLVMDIKQKKHWNVDWIRLLVIGIPFLYIALYPLLFNLGLPLNIPYITGLINGTRLMFPTIAGIIFGYVLLDSLIKKY
ncbi:hypothetical protein [Bacillus litorisediminis]|uniref:hypothetical protein n=1 Tax=Bacillus litorisediminis TaxID=2922713 RepID=UPI001FAE45D8|nr:hypothetical protein [Bacillus litorisediminis]